MPPSEYLKTAAKEKDQRGMSILFAVFTLLLLSVVGITVFSMISIDIESAINRVTSCRSLRAAEAGVYIGARAVKDDVVSSDGTNTDDPASAGYCAEAYLDGYSASGSNYQADYPPARACMHYRNWNDKSDWFCRINPISPSNVTVWNFRQRRNLIGTRLKSAQIVMRARKTDLPVDPKIELKYTTDGGNNWTTLKREDLLSSVFYIKNKGWTEGDTTACYYKSEHFDIDWDTMMNKSDEFMIRAQYYFEGLIQPVGTPCDIDWISLKLTLEVDTLTEPWATGSYVDLPASLGNSTVESIAVSDESGKLHLNYVSQGMLEHYLEDKGIDSALAPIIVANIPLDTVEQLKSQSGVNMSEGDYNKIYQDVTVYSWANRDIMGQDSGTSLITPRAPININTANPDVLKAFFKSIDSTITVHVADILVNNIVSRRAEKPFTHMYSSYANQFLERAPGSDSAPDLTSFSGFLESLSSGILSDSQKDSIRAAADATYRNKDIDLDWTGTDPAGNEFCYYSNTFLITALSRSGNVTRTIAATYGHAYNYDDFSLATKGTFNLPTFIEAREWPILPDRTDTNPEEYWRERPQ